MNTKLYFSDKELGQKDRTTEEITMDIWEGIISVFEEFATNNYFSKNFPEKCSDNERVYGFNKKLFESRVKAEIPDIELPINIKNKQTITFLDTNSNDEKDSTTIKYYTVLDFIEFCYKNRFLLKKCG